eukprot:CAMPEP_0167805964 /NCGR_PEP_ID=MMETSP0111_2-20121227/21519_1 /TAXON_ID=91324 /ORGANISM="Lotharella globosa, Strain CCCM811" /LENGTH=253 /DNA_ID=CAMNT_0007703273 /DNA_START=311 /DNA_END=1069 /DNA_ORIENTATION=-
MMGKRVLILTFGILNEFQGMSFGTQLFDKIREMALGDLNITDIYIYQPIEDIIKLQYFQALGFKGVFMREDYYGNCTLDPTIKLTHGMLMNFPLRTRAGGHADWEVTRHRQKLRKQGNLTGLGYAPEEAEFLNKYTEPWWKVTRPNVSHNGSRMSETLEDYYARVAQTPDATLNYTKFCEDYLSTLEMNVSIGENANIATPRARGRSHYLYDSEGSEEDFREKELYDVDIDIADLRSERIDKNHGNMGDVLDE